MTPEEWDTQRRWWVLAFYVFAGAFAVLWVLGGALRILAS